ncbi:MAG: hypothetical protein ACO3C3_13355, partial [Burkholderiaceae bacterium]
DSWCHLRADLRSFAVDALQTAFVLPEQAQEVTSALIADRLDAGYGIFHIRVQPYSGQRCVLAYLDRVGFRLNNGIPTRGCGNSTREPLN